MSVEPFVHENGTIERRDVRIIHPADTMNPVLDDAETEMLFLNGRDSDGTWWRLSDLTGWWTTPEPAILDNARGWGDGSYTDLGRYSARVITIVGSFIPSTPSARAVQRARDKLLRACILVRKQGVIAVRESDARDSTDPDGWMWKFAGIQSSGAPLIETVNQSGLTVFSIGLKIADPRKFSFDTVTPFSFTTSDDSYNGGPGSLSSRYSFYSSIWNADITYGELADAVATQVNVDNIGNYIASPVITVLGPTAGDLVVSNSTTGQSLTVVQPLDPGDELVIDGTRRRVTLNGNYGYRYYLSPGSDWITINPGVNTLTANLDVNPGVEVEIYFRHAWIG